MTIGSRLLAAPALAMACVGQAFAGDARLREITYDPRAIVGVSVSRGVATLIELAPDEAIAELATGSGSDCGKPDTGWCIAAQPGGRTIYVKPKTAAKATNNLIVATDKRTYLFDLVLVESEASAVYRLVVRPAMPVRPPAPSHSPLDDLVLPDEARPRTDREGLAERLDVSPQVVNADYSVAEGAASQDIVPSLVFDDGRFTYLRFAGNRETPAVFHVLGDGSETLVNARMEGNLLVVDRVSRRLTLRSGSAVVGIWNESFDPEGRPPIDGATVDGVKRVSKPRSAK